MPQEPQQVCPEDAYAFPGPEDPLRKWAREEAAYARECDRLLRDHVGKFVAVHDDEVLGPYDTLAEALMGGYDRFGDVPIQYRPIEPKEPSDFVSLVDVHHPSVRCVD
jgi:hypothetical protein